MTDANKPLTAEERREMFLNEQALWWQGILSIKGVTISWDKAMEMSVRSYESMQRAKLLPDDWFK